MRQRWMRRFCQIFEDVIDADPARRLNAGWREKYGCGDALVHVNAESARDVDITIEFADIDTNHVEMVGHFMSCALLLQPSGQQKAVHAPVRLKFHHQESAVCLRLGPGVLNPQQSRRGGRTVGMGPLFTVVMPQKVSGPGQDKKDEHNLMDSRHIFCGASRVPST